MLCSNAVQAPLEDLIFWLIPLSHVHRDLIVVQHYKYFGRSRPSFPPDSGYHLSLCQTPPLALPLGGMPWALTALLPPTGPHNPDPQRIAVNVAQTFVEHWIYCFAAIKYNIP